MLATSTPDKTIRGQYVNGVWVQYQEKTKPVDITPRNQVWHHTSSGITIENLATKEETAPQQDNSQTAVQEQPVNIFGATQGLSPEEPATIPSTPQERASNAAGQINIRRSFPTETRFIPSNQNIKVEMKPRDTFGYYTAAPKMKGDLLTALSRAGDVETQEAARERVAGKTGYFHSAIGETATYFADTGEGISETVKNPVNLVVVGGTLLATRNPKLATTVSTALELYAPVYATQKIKDIGEKKTTIGKVSGEVIGYGSLAFVGSKVLPQPKVDVTYSRSITNRYQSDERIVDFTKTKVAAFSGKTKVLSKGELKAEAFDIGNEQFGEIGKGKITTGKEETGFDFRGVATRKEGGFDVFSITKPEKGDFVLDFTKSATRATEPLTVIDTFTRTARVARNKPIESLEPIEISSARSGEIFSKDVFSESGEMISKESVIYTKKGGVSPKQFERNFETERLNIPKNLEFEKGDTKLLTKQVAKDLPSTGDRLLQETKNAAVTKIKTLELQRVTKTASLSVGLSTMTKQKTKPVSLEKAFTLSREKTISASIIAPVAKEKPSLQVALKPMQSSKPLLQTKPIMVSSSISKIAPAIKTIQMQQISTKPALDLNIPTPQPAPIVPIALPPMISLGGMKGSSKKSRRGGKQPRKYRPSLVGIENRVKRKKGMLTGLEIRGI